MTEFTEKLYEMLCSPDEELTNLAVMTLYNSHPLYVAVLTDGREEKRIINPPHLGINNYAAFYRLRYNIARFLTSWRGDSIKE